MGRCGTGCGFGSGFGVYTQDCLDHDECVNWHGYSWLGCQDEFYETFNDANWGAGAGWGYNCSRW